VIVVVLALAIGGAFAAGVFSGGGSDSAGPPEASTNIDLQPGEVKVRWPGLGPGQAAPGLQDQVMATLGKYIDDGIVPGLRTGKVNTAALAASFDEGALAQLDGEARGVVLDEGLPKAIGNLTITSPPIDVVALNDGENKPVFATARVDLEVDVQSEKGYYTVTHEGQLVLAPTPDGTWKITAWDLEAQRTPPGPKPPATTTTTVEKKKQQ
jgi:hypothetical protein